MTFKKLIELVLQSVRRNRRDYILSSIGIVVGIATLLFFTALGNGIKTVVLEQVFVIGQLEVEKKTYDIGGMRSGGLFGGGSKLDDAMAERLSEIPGVTAVYPTLRANLPLVLAMVVVALVASERTWRGRFGGLLSFALAVGLG
ncbi:MAG: ABC transporter permease, partial [Bradymonadaceae bacterium]